MRFIFLMLALLLSFSQVSAQPLEAGEYIAKGGFGGLTIEHGTNQGQKFSINTVNGGSGAICAVKGSITNRVSFVKLENEPVCQIQFQPTAKGIDVRIPVSNTKHCQQFCGLNASFDFEYLKQPESCRPAAKAKTLQKFSEEYKVKNFKDADLPLSHLVNTCSAISLLSDVIQWRSDLAIIRFHLNNKAECLAILEPIKMLMSLREGNNLREFGVTLYDEEVAEKALKAARFNWQKCGGKLPTSLIKP